MLFSLFCYNIFAGVSSEPSHQHASSVNEPTKMLFRPPCSSTPHILHFAAGVIQRISLYYLEDPASLSDKMSDIVLLLSHFAPDNNDIPNTCRSYVGHIFCNDSSEKLSQDV